MTNTQQQLNNMYVGLVCVYWAQSNTKLGTAKQKSLQQMQAFANTIDKKNPMFREISTQVQQMTASVSKQVMTNQSSEMVLDKKQAPQYNDFGKRQVAQSKHALDSMIKRAQKSMYINRNAEQIKADEKLASIKDMGAKQNAAQYRPSNTNVAKHTPKPTEKRVINQKQLIYALMQKRMQNAA